MAANTAKTEKAESREIAVAGHVFVGQNWVLYSGMNGRL